MSAPLVEAEHLMKRFPLSRSLAAALSREPEEFVHAVDDVSLEIQPGETLGLIGESGSGKTTLGWLFAKLHSPTGGRIRFEGQNITNLSGRDRQRLSLARALSVRPKLLILDEPTSALDVAVQAQVLNRLVTLQQELRLSYLLITHNVAAVRYVADRVAVMYLGRIVEVGPVEEVMQRPIHPYTKALLAALPQPDPRRRRARYRIGGEVPTLIHPPPGCRFAPRCPFVIDRCIAEDPPLRPIPGRPGRLAACHRAEEVGDVPPEQLLVSPETPATRAETAAG